jgi:hypothetical protein
VVVAAPDVAGHVVAVMRDSIITIVRLRLSQEGNDAKTATLLGYLRGEHFSNAIQRVQENIENCAMCWLANGSITTGGGAAGAAVRRRPSRGERHRRARPRPPAPVRAFRPA